MGQKGISLLLLSIICISFVRDIQSQFGFGNDFGGGFEFGDNDWNFNDDHHDDGERDDGDGDHDHGLDRDWISDFDDDKNEKDDDYKLGDDLFDDKYGLDDGKITFDKN